MPFGNHTLLLSDVGELWAFGNNTQGQLGLGHRSQRLVPSLVSWSGPTPIQVDWGEEHSMVLDEEGGVWEAGRSRASPASSHFTRVPELPVITMIAAGWFHSAAVDTNGALWVWTSLSSDWASSSPQQTKCLPPLIKLACGYGFLVAEDQEGSLWVVGRNSDGQLGVGHTLPLLQPTLVHAPELSKGPLRCLSAQMEGMIVIDSEGGLFSAGNNAFGALGLSATLRCVLLLQRVPLVSPLMEAFTGSRHALALDEEGGAWSWGRGDFGQLGTGESGHRDQPAFLGSGFFKLLAGGSHSFEIGRAHV